MKREQPTLDSYFDDDNEINDLDQKDKTYQTEIINEKNEIIDENEVVEELDDSDNETNDVKLNADDETADAVLDSGDETASTVFDAGDKSAGTGFDSGDENAGADFEVSGADDKIDGVSDFDDSDDESDVSDFDDSDDESDVSDFDDEDYVDDDEDEDDDEDREDGEDGEYEDEEYEDEEYEDGDDDEDEEDDDSGGGFDSDNEFDGDSNIYPHESENDSIIPVPISSEMKKSYINYAMSVIVGRALPDARDGLKPVHRRILYLMNESGTTSDKPYKKSARIVGDVLGKYHPHGDSSVYDAIVRLVQDFSLRYPLIDGQGNFGSIDGDSAAAMRYTEVRMDKISNEMIQDIDKETVDFKPNYDESLKEPEVLPSKLPNLLINGSTGIAVGMATNMPPHNLTEVVDGLLILIDDPEADVFKLMTAIKGPDFPTGAEILGNEGIISAYKTGRGSIKIRSVSSIEKMRGDRERIVITEIPYQVNKARLIESIANLVRDKRVTGISDLRDESDREGIRIVIELSRGTNPDVLLNQLYKHTQLQTSFGINNLAIVDGVPRVLNLRQLLKIYLMHRKDIVLKRTQYDLRIAREREHILKGLKIAIDNIDDVIELIKASPDTASARIALTENYDLDEIQAKAILEMRLQRLTGLEIEKIETELAEIIEKISSLIKIIESDELKFDIIKEELNEIKDKYGDERRSKIVHGDFDVENEDLIPKEDVIITLTNRGYIKRLPVDTYTKQNRGGKGIIGMETKDEDVVVDMFISSTHNYILFFTNKGRVYWKKGYDIPEGSRTSKGKSVVNFLELDEYEKITACIPVSEFRDDRYLMMATKGGIVKKTLLSEFKNPRRTGIIAATLEQNDELVSVVLTDGTNDVVLVSASGKACRFSEEEVRPMGRTAKGVIGMRIRDKDDFVVSMTVVNENETLLTLTQNGYGKRTEFDEYIKKHRATQGVTTIITSERNGPVIGAKSVSDDDELILTSAEGIIIRISVSTISIFGRNTQGVRIMNLNPGDTLVSLACIRPTDAENKK